MAMDLLRPAYGKVLVDMSCGSGVFSRRFASSRQFSGLIAADYSESMLQQTQRTFDDERFSNDGWGRLTCAIASCSLLMQCHHIP